MLAQERVFCHEFRLAFGSLCQDPQQERGGGVRFGPVDEAVVEYYNEVHYAAAMLVLNGADHLTIQGNGGGYLGYLTAWLMYQLQGDQYAGGAFVADPPEVNTNPSWSWQAEKDLS